MYGLYKYFLNLLIVWHSGEFSQFNSEQLSFTDDIFSAFAWLLAHLQDMEGNICGAWVLFAQFPVEQNLFLWLWVINTDKN